MVDFNPAMAAFLPCRGRAGRQALALCDEHGCHPALGPTDATGVNQQQILIIKRAHAVQNCGAHLSI
jgi:hypothetical protein